MLRISVVIPPYYYEFEQWELCAFSKLTWKSKDQILFSPKLTAGIVLKTFIEILNFNKYSSELVRRPLFLLEVIATVSQCSPSRCFCFFLKLPYCYCIVNSGRSMYSLTLRIGFNPINAPFPPLKVWWGCASVITVDVVGLTGRDYPSIVINTNHPPPPSEV